MRTWNGGAGCQHWSILASLPEGTTWLNVTTDVMEYKLHRFTCKVSLKKIKGTWKLASRANVPLGGVPNIVEQVKYSREARMIQKVEHSKGQCTWLLQEVSCMDKSERSWTRMKRCVTPNKCIYYVHLICIYGSLLKQTKCKEPFLKKNSDIWLWNGIQNIPKCHCHWLW